MEGRKEEAFVVGAEVLDNDEEKPLVQTALDSSPKGFAKIGATVSASMEETGETAGCSLSPVPWPWSPCFSSQLAGSLDILGSISPGLHSAPTLAQISGPAIFPVSVNTLPLALAGAPASVSVQPAALAPATILPPSQSWCPPLKILSVPPLNLASVMSIVPEAVEGSEGNVEVKCKTSNSSRSCLTVEKRKKEKT